MAGHEGRVQGQGTLVGTSAGHEGRARGQGTRVAILVGRAGGQGTVAQGNKGRVRGHEDLKARARGKGMMTGVRAGL